MRRLLNFILDYIGNNCTETKEKLELHKIFLKSIFDGEDKRKNSIENKTAQLLSHTSIIFAFFSLASTFFIGRVIGYNKIILILFIVLLFITMFFYVTVIYYAIKNYRITKFKYSFPNHKNVLTNKGNNIEFMKEEIKDLLYCIDKNIEINNQKGTNLDTACDFFRYAFLCSALLVFIVIGLVLLLPIKDNNIIEIDKPIETKIMNPTVNVKNEMDDELILEISKLNNSLNDIKKEIKNTSVRHKS